MIKSYELDTRSHVREWKLLESALENDSVEELVLKCTDPFFGNQIHMSYICTIFERIKSTTSLHKLTLYEFSSYIPERDTRDDSTDRRE